MKEGIYMAEESKRTEVRRVCICPVPEPYRYFSEIFNVVKVECQRCFKEIRRSEIRERGQG